MFQRLLTAMFFWLAICPAFAAEPTLTDFRFGIVRPIAEGVFEFVADTTCIPRRYKDTGFRFGVGFNNPQGAEIEWYEIVHLPIDLRQLSGDFQRTSTKTLRTKTLSSNQPSVIDEFWFDEGDPVGKHKLDVYVNNVLRYSVDFDVFDTSKSTPNTAIHRTCAKNRAGR